VKKIVKIGQYLAKIWTKYDSLLFLGHPVSHRVQSTPGTFCFTPMFLCNGHKPAIVDCSVRLQNKIVELYGSI